MEPKTLFISNSFCVGVAEVMAITVEDEFNIKPFINLLPCSIENY